MRFSAWKSIPVILLLIFMGSVLYSNTLGVALFRLRNLDGAIDHFKAAVQSNPDYEKAKFNLKKIMEIKEKSKKHFQENSESRN